jgi:hypothetical protein
MAAAHCRFRSRLRSHRVKIADLGTLRQVSLNDWWGNGDRSILAGLVGAWFGVHLGKRLTGYRESTGDACSRGGPGVGHRAGRVSPDRTARHICTHCDLGIGTLTTLLPGSFQGSNSGCAGSSPNGSPASVKPFMDISTMIEERLTQCCVHVGTKSDAGVCSVLCCPGVAGPGKATNEHSHGHAASPSPPGLNQR